LKLYSYTLGLYQFQSTIILIDVLLSCTCFVKLWHIFFSTCISKNVIKCILKYIVFQYYAMKWKNFLMLIIDLNNIHEFNILTYTLCIFSKKTTSVSDLHTLPCLYLDIYVFG
jgi:hypothetical protein